MDGPWNRCFEMKVFPFLFGKFCSVVLHFQGKLRISSETEIKRKPRNSERKFPILIYFGFSSSVNYFLSTCHTFSGDGLLVNW